MTIKTKTKAKGMAKGTKLPKNNRPRSKLQQITCQANWVCNFRMHPLTYSDTSSIVLSSFTKELIDDYNKAQAKVQRAIKMDAKMTKDLIRARDAKIKADAAKAAKSIHDDCYKQSTGTG